MFFAFHFGSFLFRLFLCHFIDLILNSVFCFSFWFLSIQTFSLSLYRSNFKQCFLFFILVPFYSDFFLSLYRFNFKQSFCFSFWFLSIQTFSFSLYRSNFEVCFFILFPLYANFISTNKRTTQYYISRIFLINLIIDVGVITIFSQLTPILFKT